MNVVISSNIHPKLHIERERWNEKHTSPSKQIIKEAFSSYKTYFQKAEHCANDRIVSTSRDSVPHLLLPVSSGCPTTYNNSTLEGQFRGTKF